jgi:3-deoxy-D-manno-octulosonic-acid transferase
MRHPLDPELNILVTTGTVTSARLLAERLPERAIHQYVPVDRSPWVARFLDHWRPNAALWVESELWPNLVLETQAHHVPMVLLNGRMSARSFARWHRFPGLISRMLSGFTLVTAQDELEADRFEALGANAVTTPGNLKFAAGALPFDEADRKSLEETLAGRPRWLAASTHEGEEEIAAYVHRRLAADQKGLITLIVPRHPGRGAAIAAKLAIGGFSVARREAGDPVTPETDIYIADTLGELGLFYRVSPIAFLGGSLIPHGGQNLLEPARLGCATLHGPHMENFRTIVAELAARGGAQEVADAEELVKATATLLTDEELRHEVAEAAHAVATAKDEILVAVLDQLKPVLAGCGLMLANHDRGSQSAGPDEAGAPTGLHAPP